MSEQLPERRRELAADRYPWEKQPWESWKAFHSFALYRDLSYARSLTKAAQAINEESPERAVDSIRRQLGEWSGRHYWVERCDAYDRHLDERNREEREGRIGRMNRRYEAGFASLSALAMKRITGDGEDQEPLDLSAAGPMEVAQVLTAAQRGERLATGQATELVNGAFQPSMRDVQTISRDLVAIALRYIPEDRQGLYASDVQAYAATGRMIE